MTEGNNQNGRGERPFSITRELAGGPPSRRIKQEDPDPLRTQPRHKREIMISNGDISRWKKDHHKPTLPPSITKIEQKPRAIPQRPKEMELDRADFIDDDVPYADEHPDDEIPWAELGDSSSYTKNELPKEDLYKLPEETPRNARSAERPNLTALPALIEKKDVIPYAEPADPEGIKLGEDTPSIREAAIYLKDEFNKKGDTLAAELVEFIITNTEHRIPTQKEAINIIGGLKKNKKPEDIEIISMLNYIREKLVTYLQTPIHELQQKYLKTGIAIEYRNTALIPKIPEKEIPYAELGDGQSRPTTPMDTVPKPLEHNIRSLPPRQPETTTSVAVNAKALSQAEIQMPKKGFLTRLAENRVLQKITKGVALLSVVFGLKSDQESKLPSQKPIPSPEKRTSESEDSTQRKAMETAQQAYRQPNASPRSSETEVVNITRSPIETSYIAQQPTLRTPEIEKRLQRNSGESAEYIINIGPDTAGNLRPEDEARLNKYDKKEEVVELDSSVLKEDKTPKKTVIKQTPPAIPKEAWKKPNTHKPPPLRGEAFEKWNTEMADAMKEAKLAALTPEQIAVRNQAIDTVLQTDREANTALEAAADAADDGVFDKKQFDKRSERIMDKHIRELKQIDELLIKHGALNPELSKMLKILKGLKQKNSNISDSTAVLVTLGKLSMVEQIKAQQQADTVLQAPNSFDKITQNLLKSIAK